MELNIKTNREIVEMTSTEGYVVARCSDGTIWYFRIGYANKWVLIPSIPN